jgi:hypothetical protein
VERNGGGGGQRPCGRWLVVVGAPLRVASGGGLAPMMVVASKVEVSIMIC